MIVGGTVFGGPGNYTRTCVGALFLTVLTTVLVGHGASPADEEIVYGVDHPGRHRRLRPAAAAAGPHVTERRAAAPGAARSANRASINQSNHGNTKE